MTTPTETAATDEPIRIQPATADALPYVLSTWGRQLEKKLEAQPERGFLKAFAPIQAKLIRRSQVLTAMRGERIAGFIVYEPGVLHWISVRTTEQPGGQGDERRKGVGSALFAKAFMSHTAEEAHGSARAMRLLNETKPVITFWTSDLRHLGIADAPYTPFWLRF
jgi:hypothetical protein